MSLKKNLHSSTLVSQQATSDYQQEFRRITEQINDSSDITDWYNLYRKLVFWEMELAQTDTNMDELLLSQKSDANAQFCKYIKRNYESWIDSESRPLMSNDVFKRKVFLCSTRARRSFSCSSIISVSTNGASSSRCLPNTTTSRKTFIAASCRRRRSMHATPFFRD